MELLLIVIFVNFISSTKNECALNNELIPEGCHHCIGTNFDDVFQIGICNNTYLTISRCDLGKRCTMKTKCQASCEVVDERECTVQVCQGNNCSQATKKDGCTFCNGAWQAKRTDMVVCRSGELVSQSCLGNKWCLGQGECKAHCGKVGTNKRVTTTRINPTSKSSTGKILAIVLPIIVFIILMLIILGVCWHYRKRILRRYNKSRAGDDSRSIEMYLKKLTSPSPPNLSNIRLITLNQLKIDKKKLGEGEFAAVYAAKLILGENSDKKFPVAAKIIHPAADLRHSVEYAMIRESGIMAQLDHEHLLKLVGICVANGIKLVTPLRPLGSLYHFLQTKKQYLGPRDLVIYCYQISSAMEYLAKNKIVHRDLATRNVLMKSNNHIEVADFGLSSLIEGDIRTPTKLPFRWVPMECLKNLSASLYCEATDVWSFGVTCWEILTFAKLPYENLFFEPKTVLQTLYKYLSDGNRLEKPDNCGLEFYQMLSMCWSQYPTSRPKFSMLKETLEMYKKDPFAYVSEEKTTPSNISKKHETRERSLSLSARKTLVAKLKFFGHTSKKMDLINEKVDKMEEKYAEKSKIETPQNASNEVPTKFKANVLSALKSLTENIKPSNFLKRRSQSVPKTSGIKPGSSTNDQISAQEETSLSPETNANKQKVTFACENSKIDTTVNEIYQQGDSITNLSPQVEKPSNDLKKFPITIKNTSIQPNEKHNLKFIYDISERQYREMFRNNLSRMPRNSIFLSRYEHLLAPPTKSKRSSSMPTNLETIRGFSHFKPILSRRVVGQRIQRWENRATNSSNVKESGEDGYFISRTDRISLSNKNSKFFY